MNTQNETTKSSKKMNADSVNTLKSIVFAVCIVLAIPLLIPLFLKIFSIALQSEFSIAMANVAKAWTFITQIVAVFLAVKYQQKIAYFFMIVAPLLLLLIEALIYVLALMPIW